MNDYNGARAAGMQAVLFDPKGSENSSTVVRIKRLRDLTSSRRALE